MTDVDDKLTVRRVLETAGLRVEEIPTATTKTCDLRANDGREHYLIEVKSFHDDARIEPALRMEGEYEGERMRDYLATVRSAVADAVVQMRATAHELAEGLWFVALIARTVYGPDVTMDQIEGILYGIGRVFDMEAPKAADVVCLYFSESAFFHHPDLDGAIVIGEGRARICLNDHGRHVDRARNSALCRSFAQRGDLCDPAALEREHAVLVADCDMDRRDEQSVLRYLEQKYKLTRAIALDPRELSAMVCFPNPQRGIGDERTRD